MDDIEIDVLVVCQHDQEMVRRCLESARDGADHKVNLWLWINNAYGPGQDGLRDIATEFSRNGGYRSETNQGFIRPNNCLARDGHAPYICLLNADTLCAPGWDTPLLQAIESGADIVGYGGALLGRDMVGVAPGQGSQIDYVEGWCLMAARATWEALGGFDEANLTLAYGEDSDLCLRAKERGYGVFAVPNVATDHYGPLGDLAVTTLGTHGQWVEHLGGQGATKETQKSSELQHAVAANHVYLRERHRNYLALERMLIKGYRRPDLSADYFVDNPRLGENSGQGSACVPKCRNLALGEFLRAREVDGRLWQVEVAGMRPVRILAP